jgi:hypothetical protein
MKIVGAGLSKTGTTTLHHALEMLGYSSIHFYDSRLDDVVDGRSNDPDFRRYDDVDAVLDIPASYFFKEILDAYPKAKAILTIRDEDEWWRSVEHHFNVKAPIEPGDSTSFKALVRNCVYGSTRAHEFLYRLRYRQHNARVIREVPPERLLIMDIPAGDGWERLCPFLEVPIPGTPFPHVNATPGTAVGETP